MFAYIQDQWIHDLTNQNMDGNYGWHNIAGNADDYNFRNEKGLPCLKYIGGQIIEDSSYPEPEPMIYVSEAERLDAIEAVILELLEE